MQKPALALTKAQEDDIREAVFRYHLKDFQIKSPKPFYFLAINHANPSPRFMARFRNEPTIKRVSEVKPKTFDVTDKATGKRGVVFYADQVRLIAANQAKIETGWRTSGRGGTFGTCLVERQKSGWVVLYYAIRGIS